MTSYSMTRLIHLDSASAEIFRITDRSEYGIDEEPPFPEIDTLNNVEIPASRVSLCNFYMEELSSTVFHTCSRWQRSYWFTYLRSDNNWKRYKKCFL